MRQRGESRNRAHLAMTPERAGIATRLSHCVREAGLSLREVDALAGTTECHARMVSTGKILDPRVSTLCAFADIFGVSLDWLVRGVGERPTAEALVAAVERARATHGAREALRAGAA